MKKLSVINEIRETFKDVPIGKEFETRDIKRMVYEKFGRNEGSVIPSDCSYNMMNKGIENSSFRDFNIFVQVKRGLYRYVGENYSEYK